MCDIIDTRILIDDEGYIEGIKDLKINLESAHMNNSASIIRRADEDTG
jgi:hypothetical protein